MLLKAGSSTPHSTALRAEGFARLRRQRVDCGRVSSDIGTIGIGFVFITGSAVYFSITLVFIEWCIVFGLLEIGFVLHNWALDCERGCCDEVRESCYLPICAMFSIVIHLGRAFGIGFVLQNLCWHMRACRFLAGMLGSWVEPSIKLGLIGFVFFRLLRGNMM